MSKPNEKLIRKHVVQFQLNDRELNVLNKFIKKYRIKNKSKLIRETLFSYILEQFDKDYPTLFPENKDTNKSDPEIF